MKRFAFALAFVLAGCPTGPGNNNTTIEPTLSSIQENIFELPAANCIGCHKEPDSLAPQVNVNLLAGHAYDSLVGKPATSEAWNGTEWEGIKVVEPGNPDRSALYLVLAQPAGLPIALKMPNGAKLNQARIDAVKQWIEKGAPND